MKATIVHLNKERAEISYLSKIKEERGEDRSGTAAQMASSFDKGMKREGAQEIRKKQKKSARERETKIKRQKET